MATLLAVAILPARVAAHAAYERSNPPAEGTVRVAPPRLDVWFTQELFRRAGANRLEVTGPDGQPAHSGEAVIDDNDRTHLSVPLAANLPPGTYSVHWATLSATDGDTAEGTFTFTVDPSASEGTATPSAPPVVVTPIASAPPVPISNAETPESGEFPWWALGAAAAILMSGATVAATILLGERGR